MLAHTAGIPALRLPSRLPIMYDQDAMIEVVAFEPLWWDPGADLGYGATPYGWMCALGCKRRISSHCEF